MAQDYRYFAANERTFLAWMRTAVTIIALGFALDKFELLTLYLPKAAAMEKTHAGTVLIILGIAVIAGGWFRFTRVHKDLLSDTDNAYRSAKLPTLLAMALLMSGVGLLLYIVAR